MMFIIFTFCNFFVFLGKYKLMIGAFRSCDIFQNNSELYINIWNTNCIEKYSYVLLNRSLQEFCWCALSIRVSIQRGALWSLKNICVFTKPLRRL